MDGGAQLIRLFVIGVFGRFHEMVRDEQGECAVHGALIHPAGRDKTRNVQPRQGRVRLSQNVKNNPPFLCNPGARGSDFG